MARRGQRRPERSELAALSAVATTDLFCLVEILHDDDVILFLSRVVGESLSHEEHEERLTGKVKPVSGAAIPELSP